MKKILQPGRNCIDIIGAPETGLIVDAREYYMAFYKVAQNAKRYILIAGWQFDSTVKLLRGEDAVGADKVVFRDFLDGLCARNQELEVYILAWDFNIIYSIEREWFQKWAFDWTVNERMHFRFDSAHAVGASHHQKFAVVDGMAAFVGGIDICSDRWDDRRHLYDNPHRVNEDGSSIGPYHDVQSFHTGPVAEELKKLFLERWEISGGGRISLPSMREDTPKIDGTVTIASDRVAISRTIAKTLVPPQEPVEEIKYLYLDAIASTQSLIYIENQYFTSRSVYSALIRRMETERSRPVQIVIILPKSPNAFSEEVSMGVIQTKLLRSLKNAASKTGHSLGIYYTASKAKTGEENPTYIHSKILLVDDRFLTVGSANTTNRSIGLDTELNVAWEVATANQKDVIGSIKSVRVELLAEHCGIEDRQKRNNLSATAGLVTFLDGLTEDASSRLKQHPVENPYADSGPLKDLESDDFYIDPEKALIEENVYEMISQDKQGLFSRGILALNNLLYPDGKNRTD